MKAFAFALIFFAQPVFAELLDADIVLSGEIHDNPAHQLGHADHAAQISAKAIVFEMLTPSQADGVRLSGDAQALSTSLGWDGTGWPAFEHYFPIFQAAPQALIYGAGLPPAAARAAFSAGVVDSFAQAAKFGLDQPLPEAEQETRLQMQADAHCGALPPEMLPAMVDIQRLRDARLAQTALRAFKETGGPVLIVTGNGHARKDWGVPVYLRTAQPGLTIFSVGQIEHTTTSSGTYDQILRTDPVERGDPCDAFKAQ